MFCYNPIGKTLAQIHKDCGGNLSGYCIFILADENDTTGQEIGMDISIGAILRSKDNMQYADYIVKYENDFFGITVLRAIK